MPRLTSYDSARTAAAVLAAVLALTGCEANRIADLDPPALLAPTPPTGFLATAGVNEVDLTWEDNSVTETGFKIQRREQVSGIWGAWAPLVTAPTDATAYTDETVTAWHRYQYRIRACDPSCTPYSTSRPVTPQSPAPPAAPSNASGTSVVGEIAVFWTDNSDDETRFSLMRREWEDGVWGPYIYLSDLDPDIEGYIDGTVEAGNRYRFRVRACNPLGCSAWATTPVLEPITDFSGSWEGNYTFGPMTAVFGQTDGVINGAITDALNCVWGVSGTVSGDELTLPSGWVLLVAAHPNCEGLDGILTGTLDSEGNLTGSGTTIQPGGAGTIPWTFSMSRTAV
jgi:hypothetical protein